MAIVVPVLFTPIQDAEVKYKRSVNEETIRKMVQDVNFLGKLAPIGTVRGVQLNQTGVQVPDSTIWQLMDGTEITYPNSPLRSVGLTLRFTPSMISKYIRGAPSVSFNGSGGFPTVDLSHDHGGTGSFGGITVGEEGDEKTARIDHSHPISSDLNPLEPLEPAYQKLAFYMKIT